MNIKQNINELFFNTFFSYVITGNIHLERIFLEGSIPTLLKKKYFDALFNTTAFEAETGILYLHCSKSSFQLKHTAYNIQDINVL